MNVIGFIGLLAPAGTPVEFIEQIAQATARRWLNQRTSGC